MTLVEKVAPWQRRPCSHCGCMMQATRGEAREVDLDALQCDVCEASNDAFEEGRRAERAEIVEMLRKRLRAADDCADMLQDAEAQAVIEETRAVLALVEARGKDPSRG